MQMRWDGVTPEQYDEIRDLVDWESVAPAGGKYHIAFFDNGVFNAVDVWDSAEQFQALVETSLMPVVAKVGITTEPAVTITPTHRVFDARRGDVVA
jgi:hypothetical protein